MLKRLRINVYVTRKISSLKRHGSPWRLRRFAPVAALVLLGACSFQGQAVTLVDQRATWFSYIAGEDLRPLCLEADGTSAAPDRYRLVYNADFNEQVRGYDVIPARDGGALLRQTVDRGISLAQGVILPGNPISPQHTLDELTAEEVAELESLLAASGVFDPPPVGLRLNSQQFYWLAMGCRQGAFFLTGYEYPSPSFAQISFDDWLADKVTGGRALPIADERLRTQPSSRCPSFGYGENSEFDPFPCFDIQIGEAGLVGTGSIF